MNRLVNLIKLSVLFIFSITVFSPVYISAKQQNPVFQGVIKELVSEEEVNFGNQIGLLQRFNVEIQDNSQSRIIEAEGRFFNDGKSFKYSVGDSVYVLQANLAGQPVYNVIDYVRTPGIYLLFGIFATVTLLIAGFKGFKSLLALILSFAIIFIVVLPSLLSGSNPIIVIILACSVIVVLNYYLSHDFSIKSTIAIIGTVISLVITVLFAELFVNLTRLTGFAAEEANFLDSLTQGNIDIRALLMAGVIIGMVGILDDITISQSAIAYELKKTDKTLNWRQLYKKTMNIGRDHIASVVNTLILVYTSASLPLLLLFINSRYDFTYILNLEIVSQEVITTLITSTGLIIAVPITTFIASYVFGKSEIKEDVKDTEKHFHDGHYH